MSSDSVQENRKRIMNTPLTFPSRPRQLMKNCCIRKNLDEPKQLPSPSTEFSRILSFSTDPLDLSLSNPCFGAPFLAEKQQLSQTPTETNVENPVFGLMPNEEDKPCSSSSDKPTPKKARHHIFNFLARKTNECNKLSSNRFRCRLGRCYKKGSPQTDDSNNQPALEGVRFQNNRYSKTIRSSLNIMPTLPDDDSLDSGKGTSVSRSVSTEDGDHEGSKAPPLTTAPNSTTDPEKDSVSSGSSIEITVQ